MTLSRRQIPLHRCKAFATEHAALALELQPTTHSTRSLVLSGSSLAAQHGLGQRNLSSILAISPLHDSITVFFFLR